MDDRSDRISRLLSSQKSRVAYIKAKLGVLVPAQIRSLRLKSTNPPMPYQRDLAQQTEMHQSRLSMFETPGTSNMTLETLSKVAAGLGVGVIVKFVPFSDMLRWENDFHPDFDVMRIEEDTAFLNPMVSTCREVFDFNTQIEVAQGEVIDPKKKVSDPMAEALTTKGLNNFEIPSPTEKKPSQFDFMPLDERQR